MNKLCEPLRPLHLCVGVISTQSRRDRRGTRSLGLSVVRDDYQNVGCDSIAPRSYKAGQLCKQAWAHLATEAKDLALDALVLEIDSDSPMIHAVDEDTPTTYAYRACYIGKNLKLGPFGDPAVCTVSV